MSYIDRDKVLLPEIVGHLRDHYSVYEGGLLHWLFPEKELEDGLRVLFDDDACLKMSQCIVEMGVAVTSRKLPKINRALKFLLRR